MMHPASLPTGFDRVVLAASGRVGAASAAAFRIAFGLLGLFAVGRFAAHGWIAELYIDPERHFKYLGFEWVQPWPAWGMYLHFALLGVASLGVALGYRYRLSIAAFFVLFTYVELIDKTTYLNHYYWVSLVSFLMIFMPLHRTASLDALRRPAWRRDTIPVWVIWTLRAQLGVVYLFSGIAKLNPDWLLHAQPLRIWLYNNGDLFLVGPLLKEAWVAYAMSWAGAAFDLTIVGWLLWRRSRPFAYLVVIAFHLATWVLFHIGIFPWVMILGTLVFFSPDWPRRLLAWLRRRPPPKAAFTLLSAAPPGWPARAAAVALGLFALAQLIVPLRHWAYPGEVRFNEEGYRFAWRVMLTEKTGHALFRVTDPATGEQWLAYPAEYLTPLQAERMAYQPDMILETAHFIADDFRQQGRDVEVRADVFVTFNGRPAVRFIDPDVDLARIAPGLAPKPWILPAPDSATMPPLT
ncbi:MAG: HTTM domain-containing protein [Chloroflexota bacterium]|nr:HTTM domain-containing protein [Chloroflexota bacterium]